MRVGFVIWLSLLLTEYAHAVLTEADFCIKKCCKRKSCLPQGNYQSCKGCHVYATCDVLNTFIDNRPCPMGEEKQDEWDDNQKRCVKFGFSDTCGSGLSRTTAAPPTPPETTQAITCAPDMTTATIFSEGTGVTRPGQCVTSCNGMQNGNYQSCRSCEVYTSCYKGEMTDNRPCSTKTRLVWNDYKKMCVWPYQDNTCDAPANGYDDVILTIAPPDIVDDPVPEQTVCKRTITQVLNVTVDGDCLAPEILQTRCEGECVTGEVYAGVSDSPKTFCSCCKAVTTVQKSVVVTCPVATDDLPGITVAAGTPQTYEKTYFYPLAKTCACEPCEG